VRNDGESRNGARERGRQWRGAPAMEGDGSDGGSTTAATADRRRQGRGGSMAAGERQIDGGRGIFWSLAICPCVWGTTATHD
jgi:hypothetical protein